jgi:hypothetical protein
MAMHKLPRLLMSVYLREARRIGPVLMVAAGLLWAVPWSMPSAQNAVRVRVETRDRATGQLVAARLYLTDTAGTPHTPDRVIRYDKGQEHHFVAAGRVEFDLPPGMYHLVVERGTEYLAASEDLTVRTDGPAHHTIWLQRWIDMNRRGWYSGDLHNHRRVDEMPVLMQAEDLNLAPTISDWIWEDHAVAEPPKVSSAFQQAGDRHQYSVLDKEVERLEAGPGAVALLGLRAPVSFEGYRLYPPNAVFCKRAREQGGYIDAEKIVWRDGAALAALGLIDFVGIVHNHFNRHDVELETDRWGMIPKSRPEFDTVAGMPLWSMEVYYHLLSCGFRLPVSAGSASGVKAAPLGYNRVYVQLTEPFSYAAWFRALKGGRSFATNGPMLFLSADGQELGSVISGNGGRKVRVRVAALSPRPLERLEIVANGLVIHRVSTPDADGRWHAEVEHSFVHNGWVAARAFEPARQTIRFAHTSPIYIDTGRPAPAVDSAKFFLEWIDREIAFFTAVPGFRDPRHRAEMLDFFREARAVYARLADVGSRR